MNSFVTEDVRELELKAASASLGADAADLEYLLFAVVGPKTERQQIQRLLEQAWTRLRSLRECVDELAARFNDTEIMPLIEDANDALESREPLAAVEALFERALHICHENGRPNDDAACLRGAQALTVALSVDFRRAAAFCHEAAEWARADPQASGRYRLQQAEFLLDQGREFRDIDALQAVERLCLDTLAQTVPADRQTDDRARSLDSLGGALGLLGRQHRGIRLLERAIEAFEEALILWGRERKPGEWAATQNHLGNVKGILGQRQQDEALLAQSITAFEAALDGQARKDGPDAWASAQSNLAVALQTMGQQKKDTKLLSRAVEGYKFALLVWTKERKPLVWAATMSHLGSALRLLGGLRKGPRTLEQSVAAYSAALSVQTRGRLPEVWAMTQNDMGAALQALAERTEDPVTFGRAIAAYRDALKEITHEKGAMTWAMSIANLGVARRKFAEIKQDVHIARQSTVDIKHAVDVFRGASHAKLTELGEEQLSLSRKLVTALESAEVRGA